MKLLFAICITLIALLFGFNSALHAFPLSFADTLDVTVTVDYPSKCGRPTGRVTFTVSGGSGQYAYSLGGPQVFGLPPGPGFGIVVDNVSGIADTGYFDIPVVSPEGIVALNALQPPCFGGIGNVSVAVTPGANFLMPYTFSVTTAAGQPANPGALPAGAYFVHVADADSCLLPPQPLFMNEPDLLVTQVQVTDGNCAEGGRIALTVSGGTGSRIADWLDINGIDNPLIRNHLKEGRYSVVVYDSLFCKDSIGGIIVKNNCQRRDTLHLFATPNSSNTLCLPVAPGLVTAETDFQLITPSPSSNGSWVLNGHCLQYNALNSPGYDKDFICIKATTPALMNVDTICIAVSIAAAAGAEVVNFTAQVNTPTAACSANLPTFTNQNIIPLNIAGFSGTGEFGQYKINPVTSCITYTPFEIPQFFADSIAVAVCQNGSLICHIITYVPSVLPATNCPENIIPEDTLVYAATDCYLGTSACLPIHFVDILNFNILDNGTPYINGASGCIEQPATVYDISNLPNTLLAQGGPYQLEEWTVNGVIHTGMFNDLSELVMLMNHIDPSAGWLTDTYSKIEGAPGSYGPLMVSGVNGNTGQSFPSIQNRPAGSILRVTPGEHTFIFKKIQTGCIDTAHIKVTCSNCNPVHNYPTDLSGTINWKSINCSNDTILPTTISFIEINDWEINEPGYPALKISDKNGNIGLSVDTGFHFIYLRNKVTTCEYNIALNLTCGSPDNDDELKIYTGMSPNGDDQNDVWYIDGLDNFPDNEVWVYNTQGNEVFHQKNYDSSWDGTWKGKLLPDGVYYYVVDLGDGSRLRRGSLTIQR